MKNFYESTVIKDTLLLDISMRLTPVDNCYCVAKINDVILIDDVLSTAQQFDIQMPLDELNFTIEMVREHPQAIIVELSIDNKEILPAFMHLAEPPTHYIHINGTWRFSIPNFYTWYHNVTWQGWIA